MITHVFAVAGAVLLLIGPGHGAACAGPTHTETARTFSKARIFTVDGERLECKQVLLSGDSVSFAERLPDGVVATRDLPLQEVARIEAQIGNSALAGTLVGGAVAGVVSLTGVAGAEPGLSGGAGYAVLILTGLGATVGGVIGALNQDWETVYPDGSKVSARLTLPPRTPPASVQPEVRLALALAAPGRSSRTVGLGIRPRF